MHKWDWNSCSWHYWPCDIATHMRKVVATPRVIWVSLGPGHLMEKMTNNRTESKKTASEASRAGDWGRFLLIPRSHGILLPKCTRLLVHLPPPPPLLWWPWGARFQAVWVCYVSLLYVTNDNSGGRETVIKVKKKLAQFVICKWIFLDSLFLRPHLKQLFPYIVTKMLG